jgi:ribonuclease P protein component
VVQEADREAHLPAQQPSARQAPRLSAPHVDPGGSGRAEDQAAQGSPQALRLTWRVRDRQTFAGFRRSGRRVRSGVVTLTHVTSSTDSPPRVAYVVGRRVGGAVERNRVRRRLRAIVREVAVDPGLAPGAYLIGASPDAVTSTYAQIDADVRASLARLSRAKDGDRG